MRKALRSLKCFISRSRSTNLSSDAIVSRHANRRVGLRHRLRADFALEDEHGEAEAATAGVRSWQVSAEVCDEER